MNYWSQACEAQRYCCAASRALQAVKFQSHEQQHQQRQSAATSESTLFMPPHSLVGVPLGLLLTHGVPTSHNPRVTGCICRPRSPPREPIPAVVVAWFLIITHPPPLLSVSRAKTSRRGVAPVALIKAVVSPDLLLLLVARIVAIASGGGGLALAAL